MQEGQKIIKGIGEFEPFDEESLRGMPLDALIELRKSIQKEVTTTSPNPDGHGTEKLVYHAKSWNWAIASLDRIIAEKSSPSKSKKTTPTPI